MLFGNFKNLLEQEAGMEIPWLEINNSNSLFCKTKIR